MKTLRIILPGTALGLVAGVILVIACGGESASQAQTPTRSSVAGTWSLTGVGGLSCVLHLAGTDAALTGAATCQGTSAGAITGDYYNGQLRLNMTVSPTTGAANLIDATVAGGTGASGTLIFAGSVTGVSITMNMR